LKVFDKLKLNKEQFIKIVDIAKRFYKSEEKARVLYEKKGWSKAVKESEKICQEYEDFCNTLPDMPTKKFWIKGNDE
jgi:hypothetical protein